MVELKVGNTPLVSAKSFDNGYKNFVSGSNAYKEQFPRNCLTPNNNGDGGVGISYCQQSETVLDSHVKDLKKNCCREMCLAFYFKNCYNSKK